MEDLREAIKNLQQRVEHLESIFKANPELFRIPEDCLALFDDPAIKTIPGWTIKAPRIDTNCDLFRPPGRLRRVSEFLQDDD